MIIAKKGYTLQVTSWENDGDNYRTKQATYETKQEATAIAHLCKTVFASCNNGEGGIGNSCGDDEISSAREIIIDFFKENPYLLKGKNLSEGQQFDLCMNIHHDLLGGSEYYYARVFESAKLFYLPEDIIAEEIKL